MTTYPAPSNWICSRLTNPHYRNPSNRDLAEWLPNPAEHYWPVPYELREDDETYLDFTRLALKKKLAPDPTRPYLLVPGSAKLFCALVRPLDSINAMCLDRAWGLYRREYREVHAARLAHPCRHDDVKFPSDGAGYRISDSPIFLPCEAHALLGPERAAAVLLQLERELRAAFQLATALLRYYEAENEAYQAVRYLPQLPEYVDQLTRAGWTYQETVEKDKEGHPRLRQVIERCALAPQASQ